ncbi:unnamed protein product [Prorocentrum cordatum]|uniref:RanBP2-type domain-containing protein n=2 Tax=Prorocentrum cordatum TaxID=2364126 RepID=A0ABN9T834_9DINO|nr:unnamed protein product [Polarella glacialis]
MRFGQRRRPPPSAVGAGGVMRRDGDWDCPRCGKMVFASKDECFACGEPKSSGGRGGDRYDDRRGGGDRYDDRDRRRRRDYSEDDYDRDSRRRRRD